MDIQTLPSTAVVVNENSLVTITAGQPTTTSLLIAETFGKRHDNVIAAIRKLECSDSFRLLNFKESSYLNEQGKSQPMFIITEKGFSMLAMGFTGKRAAEWREKYVDAFDSMKTALIQRQSAEWQESRHQGKQIRRQETDYIKRLVEYATTQGSRNASWYYRNFTELAYRALGFQGEHRPIRELLTPQQQAALTLIESAVSETIKTGIEQLRPYKEIYRAAAGRVWELASALTPAVRPLLAA